MGGEQHRAVPGEAVVRRVPRRAALAGALGGTLAFLALKACAARAAAGPLFVVCRVHPVAGSGVAGIDATGHAATAELPGRGHGICLRPGTGEAVVFARRPGTFAAVFEPASGLVVRRFDTPPGRHFFGHGTFDAEGRLLFATENDPEGVRGVLGVYDAADGYRRLGELPTHGIGPHDVTFLPGGTLVVANGGIHTRPETGRTKLNLATMRSGLAFLDPMSGRLLDERRLAPALRLLSLRHVDITKDGRMVAAMQWEGDPAQLVPLLALADGAGLRLLDAPPHELAEMAGYIGAVAFDRAGGTIAASCPRGDRVAFWDADGRFLRTIAITDTCAIGPAARPGRFLAANGVGLLAELDARRGTITPLGAPTPVAYDNHLAVAPPA